MNDLRSKVSALDSRINIGQAEMEKKFERHKKEVTLIVEQQTRHLRECPLPFAGTVHSTWTLLTHINLSQTISSVTYILTLFNTVYLKINVLYFYIGFDVCVIYPWYNISLKIAMKGGRNM